MCLAIPGKIRSLRDDFGVPMARVDFGGITREACLSYIPDARIGDYVLVHVGFAISRVDEEEASRTYQYLAEMDQLSELQDGQEEPWSVGPEREQPQPDPPPRERPDQESPGQEEPQREAPGEGNPGYEIP